MIGCRSLSKLNIPTAWTLLPLRLVVRVGFLLHGLAKFNRGPAKFALLLEQIGVPFPVPTAWMVTCAEILGGTFVIIGLLVALASVPLTISMLVAMFTIHVHYGFSAINTIGLTPAGPVFGPSGYEITLVYIAGLIALALSSPTAASVDRIRCREKTNPRATGSKS